MNSRQKIIRIIDIIESKFIENWDILSEDIDEKKHADIEKIYNEYSPFIRNVARKIVHNENDVDDVQQEAIIKIYKFLRSNKEEIRELKPFVYRVTYRCALELLRKKRSRSFKKISYLDPETIDAPSSKYDPSEEDELVRGEVISDIRSAIESLPERERQAINLTQLSGMTYPEYSSISNRNPQTVKSDIFRGKSKIRKKLSNKYKLAQN